MNQPEEQLSNEHKFEIILQECSPELYLIYETQKLTQVSWEVIREAIIALHDVAWNGGTGEVRVFISRGKNTAIKGEKYRNMNNIETISDILIDKS